MTVLERKKSKLIRAIMDDTDENRISEMERVYRRLRKQQSEPCVYSVKEMNESLCKIEQDFATGKIAGYTSDQMRKRHVV